eukprot:6172300-Pleurochrysis_carterae.AAC.5
MHVFLSAGNDLPKSRTAIPFITVQTYACKRVRVKPQACLYARANYDAFTMIDACTPGEHTRAVRARANRYKLSCNQVVMDLCTCAVTRAVRARTVACVHVWCANICDGIRPCSCGASMHVRCSHP